MRKSIILVLILLAFLLSPIVSADYNPNFTPLVDTMNNSVHANQTFILSQSHSTPMWVFIMVLFIGLFCFFVSLLVGIPRHADYFGYIAPFPILISALMCTGISGIDVVTGYGATSLYGANNMPQYILLENHTIYILDVVALMLLIIFVISLLNTFRLYTEYRIFKGGPNDAGE